MDFAVLTGLVVAIMACVGVWFQARSVRVSEAQLKSQVESMQAVLDKLEVERREREAAVAQVDAQIGVIDSDIHDSHRRNWDHTTNAATLQSLHTSKLAMVTALLAHTASLFEDADL